MSTNQLPIGRAIYIRYSQFNRYRYLVRHVMTHRIKYYPSIHFTQLWIFSEVNKQMKIQLIRAKNVQLTEKYNGQINLLQILSSTMEKIEINGAKKMEIVTTLCHSMWSLIHEVEYKRRVNCDLWMNTLISCWIVETISIAQKWNR